MSFIALSVLPILCVFASVGYSDEAPPDGYSIHARVLGLAEPRSYVRMVSANHQLLGLTKRQQYGIPPATETPCDGFGTTCAEVCGAGQKRCPSNGDGIHCFDPTIGQVCCHDGSGLGCDSGYYCTRDIPGDLWCCPDELDLPSCAASLGTGKLQRIKNGLSTGAKAGIGIGCAIAAGVVAVCSYLLWKHFTGTPKPPAGDPEGNLNQNISQLGNPQDKQKHHHRRPRIKREKDDEEKHHHHNGQQQKCTDKKCFLNNKKHKCSNPKEECPCNCTDPQCPLNKEQRNKEFVNVAKDEGSKVAMQGPKESAMS